MVNVNLLGLPLLVPTETAAGRTARYFAHQNDFCAVQSRKARVFSGRLLPFPWAARRNALLILRA